MENPEVPVSPGLNAPLPAPSSFRWVRWIGAALVLIVLAFAFHTTGRAAKAVQKAARHWMAVSWKLPHSLTQSAVGALGGLTPPKTHPESSTWLAPIAGAVLVKPYGWEGRGAHAKFVPDIEVKAAFRTPVIAGVSGRVVQSGATWVIIQSQGYRIRFSQLVSPAHTGTVVDPTAAIGTLGHAPLILTVTKDGYPINPLGSVLYGSHWIRR
jgi:hypothetical protein